MLSLNLQFLLQIPPSHLWKLSSENDLTVESHVPFLKYHVSATLLLYVMQ